jgi:DNA-binding CsgD family transcriptional regulator
MSAHPARPGLDALRDHLLKFRGRARQLRREAGRMLVPMVWLDSHGHTLDANVAGRLFLRRTRDELLRMTVHDVLAPRRRDRFGRVWAELLRDGSVAGSTEIHVPDGGSVRVDYFAIANLLPGQHLFAWKPSQWPEGELTSPANAPPPESGGLLSPREREVLTLLASGATVEQIATELSVSPTTAKTHLRNAGRKLGARHRAHALAIALRTGEIELNRSSADAS